MAAGFLSPLFVLGLSVGTSGPNWAAVDESQTGGWTPVVDTQTPGWSEITGLQSANWVEVGES